MKNKFLILFLLLLFSVNSYSREFKGLGYWALDQEKECGIPVDTSCYLLLDSIIHNCKDRFYNRGEGLPVDELHILTTISNILKDFNITYDTLRSFSSALTNRKFDCRYYTLTYLTISENIRLNLSYSLAPSHMFISILDPRIYSTNFDITKGRKIINPHIYPINFETTKATFVERQDYIDNLNISKVALDNGVYLSPKSPDKFKSVILTDLGSYFVRKGEHAKAIEYFSQALSIDVLYTTAHLNIGVARSQLGDHAGAIRNYSILLDLDPNDSWAYFNRGNAEIHLNDIENACIDYKKALSLGLKEAQININQYCK
jgi:tetratricopeptide (TPR) repeat protein